MSAFDKFLKSFGVGKSHSDSIDVKIEIPSNIRGYGEFLSSLSGRSFRDGIYRTFGAGDILKWNDIAGRMIPSHSGHLQCFGYDWLGSIFAINLNEDDSNFENVVIIEPASAELFNVPKDLIDFHNDLMINDPESCLNISFYNDWLSRGGTRPSYKESVSFKTPMFLGGEWSVDNLELTDLEVYWELMNQITDQLQGVPDGTNVNIE